MQVSLKVSISILSSSRTIGNALQAIHGETAADGEKLRREPPALSRLLFRQTFPRHAVSVGQQRAQSTQGEPGEGPALQDVGDRPGETDICRRGSPPSVHQRVVR